MVRSAVLLVVPVVLALLLPIGGLAQDAESGSAAEESAAREVDVFYLTNRRRISDGADVSAYDGDRGQPRFGLCRVSFTPIPILDRVGSEVPFYVPRETIDIRPAETVDAERFLDRLAAAVEATSSRSAVVFIHGYNYGFERTCRMAAEMQRTLVGEAVVVMFSWPANGLPTDYVSDLADMEWSVPLLAEFLARLEDRFGPDGVQVLAHSMGSRGTMAALERLAAGTDRRPVVGRLVLLAPDFDSQTFVDRLPELRPLAGSITLYASSNDSPLKLSRQLSGYPRLGEAGDFLTVAPGLETIDVSPAGIYQVFGHEYFFHHPLVAADLAELLSTGTAAAGRPGLVSRRLDGTTYWEIAVDP